MNTTLSYVALGCAIIPFFISTLQFIIYLINKRKYNTLLSQYLDSAFELPPLYRFYGSMGFFGSFGMSYFFSRLKKGQKIIFQPKEQAAISTFLNAIDANVTKWLDTYYYLSIFSLLLYAVFVVMSLIKIVTMQL